jgi:predicted Zn-dependent protease
MVGYINVERGDLKDAVTAFQKGLAARVRTPEQETVLCFEIGSVYENMRQPKDALSFFQRVARRDPNYRDVQERIRRLTKPEAKPPVRQAAVGADDEFDRAFDELLGSGKLP